MKVSMFTKEEMHADQAEFRLLVLISKYARDPWRKSLTSQTDTEANGEWGAFSAINQSTTKMPRECAAVGCAELQTKGSLEIRTGNWTPTQTWTFFLWVSVTHRPAFARLILGRWKERSLRMNISRPTKGLRNTFWHLGTQCKD